MDIILEEDRNIHKVFPGVFFSTVTFIMLFVMKVLFRRFDWWMTLNNVVCWIWLLLPWIGNNCSDLLPVQIFICKFLLNKTWIANKNITFFTVCQKKDWHTYVYSLCNTTWIYVCYYSLFLHHRKYPSMHILSRSRLFEELG